MDIALLSTAYFGPVHYFTKFLQHPKRIVERYDHYSKQTYRNRCNILGANGSLTLSIPVQKGKPQKSYVKDIRIDYSKNWQKLHWKGIESAYMHSPFFEYYLDDIRHFLEKKPGFLLELNLEILDFLLESLEITGEYGLTEDFVDLVPGNMVDYRESIHPKKAHGTDPEFRIVPYPQVFSDKHGFVENLSIMDLLFNEGPNARLILEKSYAAKLLEPETQGGCNLVTAFADQGPVYIFGDIQVVIIFLNPE